MPTPKTPKAVSPMPTHVVALIFLAGIVLGGMVFTAVWMLVAKPANQSLTLPDNAKITDLNKRGQEPVYTTATTSPDVEWPKTAVPEDRVDNRTVELSVKWTEPRILSKEEALNLLTTEPTPYKRENVEALMWNYFTPEKNEEGYVNYNRQMIWEAGYVYSTGADKGNKIYILQEVEEGMVANYYYTYLMQASDTPSAVYAIGATSSTYYWYDDPQITALAEYTIRMPNASIKFEELPSELKLQNGKTLTKLENSRTLNDSPVYRFIWEKNELQLKEVAKTADGNTVYEKLGSAGENDYLHYGCLFVFGKDGFVNEYRSSMPTTELEVASRGTVKVPQITWSDGTANQQGYEMGRSMGCGNIDRCPEIVEPAFVGPEKDLKVVGKTSLGEKVYVPASANSLLVKQAYESWYLPEGDKPDIQEFVKREPYAILLWKDAVGRWTEWKKVDLMPMAECGKPVIYLYPEKATAVSVRLPGFIDVTVSEPSYPANGWKTVARPDGRLTMADGKEYGSLYWEGVGVTYFPPKTGFLVKDGEQESFLSNVLPKYGLNPTETKEFMDFWLPQMKGSPYYRVSFLTSEWDKAAPLYVSPGPDTSIRIFMDWQKLSGPMDLKAPEINTPERKGFTLVEWGGLLYK